jgi:hypothetical protein
MAAAHLPDRVIELAERLGAEGTFAGHCHFRQTGTLRNVGAKKWMRFTARQWISANDCQFRWVARVGLMGAVRVTDALLHDIPAGSVKLFGLVPLARASAGDDLLKGQLLRYLAELPWCPDGIFCNRSLRWEVVTDTHFQIGARIKYVEAELNLFLDDEGLPARIQAIRPAEQDGVFTDREWQGTFRDYRRIEGRLIPHVARVWWTLDGAPFDVWRGTIGNWSSS